MNYNYNIRKPETRRTGQIALPFSETNWLDIEGMPLNEVLEVVKHSINEGKYVLQKSFQTQKYNKAKELINKYNGYLEHLVETGIKIEKLLTEGQDKVEELKVLVVEAKKHITIFQMLLNNDMESLTYNEKTKYELFRKQLWKFYILVYIRMQKFMKGIPDIDWSTGFSEADILQGITPDKQDRVEKNETTLIANEKNFDVFAKVSYSPFRGEEHTPTLSMGALETQLTAKKQLYPIVFEKFLEQFEISTLEKETTNILSTFYKTIDEYEELRMVKGTKDVLAFFEDSEYISKPDYEIPEREVHYKDYMTSYQITVSLFGYIITFVFVFPYAYGLEKETEVSFDEIYKFVLEKLGFKGTRNKTSKPINIYRIAHNGIMDIPKLKTHECRITEKEIEKKGIYSTVFERHLSQVQGGLCTANGFIPYDIEWTDNNKNKYKISLNISVRDTMALSVSGKGLASIGEAIGFKKLKLSEETYKDMGKFFREDFNTYMAYAMRDTEICCLYCMSLFGVNKDIPLTLMSRTTNIFKERHKEESIDEYTESYLQGLLEGMKGDYSKAVPLMKNEEMTDEAYDILFRGCREVVRNDELTEFEYWNRIRDFQPVKASAKKYLALGADSYAGGLNSSYYYGWVMEETYDYDLEQAYGSAMANLPDIAFEEKPMKRIGHVVLDSMEKAEEVLWTVNGKKIPHTHPILCEVNKVSNKENKFISAFGLHLNGSIVFVNNFTESMGAGIMEHAVAPIQLGTTIHSILSMGGSVELEEAYVLPLRKNKKGCIGRSFANTISKFCAIRKDIQKKFGKKSMFDLLLKLIVNSTYGKVAQSVKPKKVYNFLNAIDDNDGGSELGQSQITNTIFATIITETARTALINTVYELMSMGYKVYSITTDGFITNAPLSVLRKTKALGLAKYYKEGLKRIGNNAEMWQVKHAQSVLYAGTTRVNLGFKKVEIYPGIYSYVHTSKCVFARGGWKITECEWLLDGCTHELENEEWFMDKEAIKNIELYKRQLFLSLENDKGDKSEANLSGFDFSKDPEDNDQLEAYVFMTQVSKGKVYVRNERKQTNAKEWALNGTQPHSYKTFIRTISLNPDGKRLLDLSSLVERTVILRGTPITLGCIDTLPLNNLEDNSKYRKVLGSNDRVYRSQKDFEGFLLRISREKKLKITESHTKVMVKDILMCHITKQMYLPVLEGLSKKEVLSKLNSLLRPEDKKLTLTDYKHLQEVKRQQKLSNETIQYLYRIAEELDSEYDELPF